MAAGTRQTNTMEENLRKMLSGVTELKLSDDPDWDFITGLETAVLSKLRQPLDQVAQQGLTAAPPELAMGGPGMGGQTPGMPPGMAMGGQQAMTPPTMAPTQQGGLNGRPSLPSPDELRRILGAA